MSNDLIANIDSLNLNDDDDDADVANKFFDSSS